MLLLAPALLLALELLLALALALLLALPLPLLLTAFAPPRLPLGPPPPRDKTLHIHFLRSPAEVVGAERHASGVVLEKTALEPVEGGGEQKARGTGERTTSSWQACGHMLEGCEVPRLGAALPPCHPSTQHLSAHPRMSNHRLAQPTRPLAGQFETIPADLVLKSIGFKSVGIPGVAFDARKGVVPNKLGQVGGEARHAGRRGRRREGRLGCAPRSWEGRCAEACRHAETDGKVPWASACPPSPHGRSTQKRGRPLSPDSTCAAGSSEDPQVCAGTNTPACL